MAAPTLSAASERDAGPHFAYSLVNWNDGALPMTALVRRRRLKFAACGLQKCDALVHMRLSADRIADAHAGRNCRAEQRNACSRKCVMRKSPSRLPLGNGS